MQVTSALLCDAANISDEGSLNVLGAFNVLYSPEFPYMYPVMSLALQFEVAPEDAEQEHEFTVQLIDPDGGLAHEGSVSVETLGLTVDGRAYRVPSFARIVHAKHPTSGDYELRILYKGDVMAMVPYEVLRL